MEVDSIAKLNCPYCNGTNTCYISFYSVKDNAKRGDIELIKESDIGDFKKVNRKEKKKIDFDGEIVSHRVNDRFCKDCKRRFKSRKMMYTVDITKIDLIIRNSKNYYRYTLNVKESQVFYDLKINWIPIITNKKLEEDDKINILSSFKKCKPSCWHGHYGDDYEYDSYYWILKWSFYNGFDYYRSGNDEVPTNWYEFIKPFKQVFKNEIFDIF